MPRGRKPLPPGEALRRKRERNRAWMKQWAAAHPDEKREANREWAAAKRARQTLDERNAAHRKAKERDPIHYLLHHAKHRANSLGIPFDLTREDLVMPEVCPVFGTPFEWGHGKMGWRNMHAPSLDKIKPQLGYVRGNVRIISTRANHVKGNATIEEMKAVLAYMEREGANRTLLEQAGAVFECEIPNE
jgi:hypothetical protein